MPLMAIPRSAAPVTTSIKCSSCIELTAAHTNASFIDVISYLCGITLAWSVARHASSEAELSSKDWTLTETYAQRLVYHSKNAAVKYPAGIGGSV